VRHEWAAIGDLIVKPERWRVDSRLEHRIGGVNYDAEIFEVNFPCTPVNRGSANRDGLFSGAVNKRRV
jgi:hypothetical protein